MPPIYWRWMTEMAMVYKHDADGNMIFASMIDEYGLNSETEWTGSAAWDG